MTGNSSWFLSFTKVENGGKVFFGKNSKKHIIGIGKVSKDSSTFTKNVYVGYFNSIAIDVNMQVYKTSNIMLSIQDRLHRD